MTDVTHPDGDDQTGATPADASAPSGTESAPTVPPAASIPPPAAGAEQPPVAPPAFGPADQPAATVPPVAGPVEFSPPAPTGYGPPTDPAWVYGGAGAGPNPLAVPVTPETGVPAQPPQGPPPGYPSAGWGTAGWPPPGTPPGGTPAAQPSHHRRRPSSPVLVGTGIAVCALALGTGLGYGLNATLASKTTQASGTSSPVHRFSPTGGIRFGHSGTTGGTRSTTSTRSTTTSGTTRSSSSGGGNISSAQGSPSDVKTIAAKVDPGLVDVNTNLGYQQAAAAGTGMVLTANGLVLTNNHVIDGATKISVTDIGNHKTYKAHVVGYDRTKDVALIQLTDASGLSTVTLGSSSSASVGEGIVGIGNAGGTGGTPSVAGGSITGLNKSIVASDDMDGTTEHLSGLIQVNAGIEPGDSGGPLVDAQGQVIGMDTAGSESSGFQFHTAPSGQAYAIPVSQITVVTKKIEAGSGSKTVHIGKTAFLGIEVSASSSGTQKTTGQTTGLPGFTGSNTTSSTSSTSTSPSSPGSTAGSPTTTSATQKTTSPSTPSTTSKGVAVAGVISGTPAAGSGLAKGDMITSVAGTSVATPNALSMVLGTKHPGDKVQVVWTDANGQQHTATVTLASGPPA